MRYRPGIGAMILNNENKVFVARRMDIASGLQMPQGGIDIGEKFETSLYRELDEEIGTANFSVISKLSFPLYYDFPYNLGLKIYKGAYIGQKIYWFLLRFHGIDSDINLEKHYQEFSEWQWTNVKSLVDNVVDFKKAMYQTVSEQFFQNL
jgi:putative (di)nucleoside polyphosphate hydrolase